MLKGPSLNLRYKNALRHMSVGQLDQAKTELVALQLANPQKAEISFQLSRVSRMEGKFTDAIRYIEQALSSRPHEPALLNEAIEVYTITGQFDKALDLHERLIELSPNDIAPQATKALFLQHTGQFEQANAIFKRLLKQHPEQPSLYRMFFVGKKVEKTTPYFRS